jgi:vacuolar-type H+-ATPase catalytic subunit A/Vma1
MNQNSISSLLRELLQKLLTPTPREDFLQQNGFSEWDRYCPIYKTFWMLSMFFEFNSSFAFVTARNQRSERAQKF